MQPVNPCTNGIEALTNSIEAFTNGIEACAHGLDACANRIEACANGDLPAQICAFLERAVLSKYDGAETGRSRVNLLTLHSTKGLEFSRVYIVGVEDEQMIPVPRDGLVNQLELEEARRLLYVGMTRTRDRLVMTRVKSRGERSTGGHRFLDEMGLNPRAPLA